MLKSLKGASWTQTSLRASFRLGFRPDYWDGAFGFRIACEVEGQDE